jgi:hypothetical protein
MSQSSTCSGVNEPELWWRVRVYTQTQSHSHSRARRMQNTRAKNTATAAGGGGGGGGGITAAVENLFLLLLGRAGEACPTPNKPWPQCPGSIACDFWFGLCIFWSQRFQVPSLQVPTWRRASKMQKMRNFGSVAESSQGVRSLRTPCPLLFSLG